MKTAKNTMIKRLVPGLVLGFVVLVGLALMGDLQEVSLSLLNFRWEFFLVAILFTLLNYTLRFFKWHFYLGQVGVHNLSRKESLRMFIAGFPLAVTPGKVGEALKGVWLKRKSSIPVGRGISVVLAERISDGLAVIMLSVVGVFAFPQYWPAFLTILVILVAIVILSQVRPVALFLLGLGEKMPLVNRLSHSLHEFYEGSFSLFRPGATLLAVLFGIISWLGEGIGFYFILLGLGLEASPSLLAMAIFVLSFSTAVGAASAMPGGLGAAEVSIAGMLTVVHGLEPAAATSATLLIRMATLWFGVGLGLLTWTFSPDLLGLPTDKEPVNQNEFPIRNGPDARYESAAEKRTAVES